MTTEQVSYRLTVEALRAGVATKSAAQYVGTTQRGALEAFRQRLENSVSGTAPGALAVGGPFGSGKSHLLQCFKAEAIRQRFAVSLVSIGAEVPMGNLHLVVRALADASEAPDVVGKALRETASLHRVDTDPFREFSSWIHEAGVHARFRALTELYERYYADDEFRLRVIDDFEGKPISKSEIQSKLKKLGEGSTYVLPSVPNAQLASERLLILSEFFRTCGLNGWVVLFDEAEVLGRFTLRQRLASYRNIGQITTLSEQAGAHLVPVFAFTDGAYNEMLSQDEPYVSGGLYYPDDESRELGMRGLAVFKRALPLVRPNREESEAILERVQTIYDLAYDVKTDPPMRDSELAGYQVRTQIRNWVTQWDLKRFYPGESLQVASEELQLRDDELDDSVLVKEDDLDG